MAKVTVNGKEVTLGDSERLNLVQAAQRAEVEIPHYCWHPSLSVVASCRMCLVEAGDKKPDGSVAMQPKLVPACQTPAKDGTVVVTDSPKVKAAQAATLEYLLLNHPLDCPICDQAGECFLQDYSFKFGHAASRLNEPKVQRLDKHHIGEHIALFTDRCVMCSRCVRFTREISGTAELHVINRGSHAEIDVFPGHPCDNKLAGNVVDICPVGALCSKDFLYKQRVWWLRESPSVCPGCSTGCSIKVDQNEERVYRLKPRSNPLAQGDFMCDEGRFGFHYIHSPERLQFPLARAATSGNGAASGRPGSFRLWEEMLPEVRTRWAEAARQGTGAAIISPMVTVEEAYLLAAFVKHHSPSAKLALGPVPVVGEDDTYPKDHKGAPAQPVKFTIRAEKCPNRKGVEAVLTHFEGRVTAFTAIVDEAAAGKLAAVYVLGGYPAPWLTPAQAESLRRASLVVAQDILPNPLTQVADFVLPGGTFAEKEGTFVNFAGLAQAITRSVRSPEEARPDGRILWELSEREGLFHAKSLRAEIAATVPALAALGVGDLGAMGVRLAEKTTAGAGAGAGA